MRQNRFFATAFARKLSLAVLFCGWTFCLFGILASAGVPALHVPSDEVVKFNRDVRPILSDKCYACHGFDPNHRQADLRLDIPPESAEAWDGWVIVPGAPEQSAFFERIVSDDPDVQMPPAETHKHLTEVEIDVLKRWIEQGAQFEGHWSFQPLPTEIPVPAVAGAVNPIDAFVRERLNAAGFPPSPPADKYTLLRRLTFSLTGLPPSLAQTQAFLQDSSPDAYERLVQELLDSPMFGEEMARHWLDLARYADTHGMHLDNERQMWAYRDWVVDSFNRNKPFDQFTIEQLAGDLLPAPTQEQMVATGFNRCNVTTGEGGSIDAELLFRYAVERASTTAETWMALTAGCAACHDHKFDPISQKEFYSLYAFFYSAADPAMDGNALLTQPTIRLDSPDDVDKISHLKMLIAGLKSELEVQAASVQYHDPALQTPPPPTEVITQWWMDDEFLGSGQVQASPGHPTTFVSLTDGGQQPFSGSKLLKRQDAGLAQDVWETGGPLLKLPPRAKFVTHVFLEPDDLPKSIMVQFNKGGWKHRGVWGDYDIIAWGAANTTERVAMGELPSAGQWVRLEFPVEQVGLNPGDEISGFALTQHGGTVYWDQVGVMGEVNPAADPAFSFQAWWQAQATANLESLPQDLREVAKQGPEGGAEDTEKKRLFTYYLLNHCHAVRDQFSASQQLIVAKEKELRDFEASLPGTFVFRDLPQRRQAYVMQRGQYDDPGEEVQPDVPQVLPPLPRLGEQSANRLDLAKWLVSPEHPLTARVAVNRYWQQFFGAGLVRSSGDFGSQGEPPSHPELLDWLARRFQDSGWDVKEIVRLIVTSETFKQSSKFRPELMELDPDNRRLARMSRPRLDAEQIRDNALFVSGLLAMEMGGKGVKPYQPPNIWEPVGFVGSNTRFYTQDAGSALYRRSIYVFMKRTAPPPFMSNFDAPNREQSCSRRGRSNTPLQALQLMNDVQHVEAARVLAARMIREGGTEPVERIRHGFQLVLARPAAEIEVEILLEQFTQHLARYRENVSEAEKLISAGATPAAEGLDRSEWAALTLIANTLLNLDETLTRN